MSMSTSQFWRKVLWTDESFFENNSSKRKIYVRLPNSVRQKNAPACQKVPHGGGSVMFWGCIARSGLGDFVPVTGSMSQNQYLKNLNDYALPAGDKLIGQEFILQQDNAP